MSHIRKIAKSCVVFMLGREVKPRRILRGLALGYKMAISPAENLSYLVGTYEPHLQRAIRRYVSAGDTVYDIGANVGYVSLSLVKQVGPTGYVAALEALPRNADALRENIRNNHLSNVHVFDVAASDRPGQEVMRLADNCATASLIWHKRNSSSIELIVKTVAVDDLVENGELPGRPSFVKIDVEGAEGLVTLGMRRTLAAAKPVVFIESSEAGRETTWQLFKALNYLCQSATTGMPVTTFEKYRHSDFLWIPERNLARA